MNSEDIKKLRKKLGMTQNDFAKAFGISFSTISRWENGIEDSKPNDSQLEQLKTLKALANKTKDYSQVRTMLTVAGITGSIALAICGGISLPGVLAGSISAILESIRISKKIKYKEGIFMREREVAEIVAEIVDKDGQIVDYITNDAVLKAANDPKNFDDTELEEYTINDTGEIDSEFGNDHSVEYAGRISLTVESKNGEEYIIYQNINHNDDVSIEDKTGNVETKNSINMPYNLNELHTDSLQNEDLC